MKKLKPIWALLAAFGLLAAACGSSTDTATEAVDSAASVVDEAVTDTSEAVADAGTDDAASMPGEGVDVTEARADWSTGYFQASLYNQLLTELGYNVSDAADLELGPSLAYLSMAQGEVDFWANSWYPGHKSFLEAELPDGSKVGDHLTVVGEEMMAGGLQGFLVTKTVADEMGITTMDQINSDPTINAAFDTDGNGVANIYGCQESWTCDNITTEMICQYGWDNIEQTIAGYDAMMAEAIGKANAGEAMAIYTWTPSAYITELRPGDNVVWLGVDNELLDTNCSEQEGGEEYAQPNSIASIGVEQCPAATDAGCPLGWTAADIQVTANSDFLAANPAAAELFAQVTLPLIDVSLANVAQGDTDGSSAAIGALAAEWITNNRALVDEWLAAARAAA